MNEWVTEDRVARTPLNPDVKKSSITGVICGTVLHVLTRPEHMGSPLSRVRVARSLVFCVIFCRSCLYFVLFLLLYYVLLFTDSDYFFCDIFAIVLCPSVYRF